MCGRFSLGLVYGFGSRFGVPQEEVDFKPRFNVIPTQEIPTILKRSPNRICSMRWGLIPSWAKEDDFNLKLINVRSETASDKPMFNGLLARQRCIIPATGFYEWKKEGDRKIPHYVRLKDEEYFGMAGIFDIRSVEGVELLSCAIITTQATDVLAGIHDRMPVILRRDDEGPWLSTGALDPDHLAKIFEPYSSELIVAHPVSDHVNNPRSEGEKLIEPVSERGQSTLF